MAVYRLFREEQERKGGPRPGGTHRFPNLLGNLSSRAPRKGLAYGYSRSHLLGYVWRQGPKRISRVRLAVALLVLWRAPLGLLVAFLV